MKKGEMMAYSYLNEEKQRQFMELSEQIECELQDGVDSIIFSRKSPPEQWNLQVFLNGIISNLKEFSVKAHILQSNKYTNKC